MFSFFGPQAKSKKCDENDLVSSGTELLKRLDDYISCKRKRNKNENPSFDFDPFPQAIPMSMHEIQQKLENEIASSSSSSTTPISSTSTTLSSNITKEDTSRNGLKRPLLQFDAAALQSQGNNIKVKAKRSNPSNLSHEEANATNKPSFKTSKTLPFSASALQSVCLKKKTSSISRNTEDPNTLQGSMVCSKIQKSEVTTTSRSLKHKPKGILPFDANALKGVTLKSANQQEQQQERGGQ